MKGTESLKVLAEFLERDERADEIDDVGRFKDTINGLLWDAGHSC
jgi:hypothetical protein